MMPQLPRTLSERFWGKVDKNGPVPAHRPELGPCWMWTHSVNEHGYGTIRPTGKRSGLAAQYNVGRPTISQIKNAKAWRHLVTEPVVVPVRERYTVVSCLCGCGGEITNPDQWGNYRRWIKGHNSLKGAAA